MGNPAIAYYPQHVFGRLHTIDLGQPLSELIEMPNVQALAETGFDGAVNTQVIAEEMRIRVSFDGFTSDALYAELFNLVRHLRRGGMFALCLDPADAWAGYTSYGLAEGSTGIQTRGNTWKYGTWNSAATLATGDIVAIAGPGELPEYASVSNVIGDDRAVIASPGLLLSYSDRPWLFVRHRDYYPALVLAPDWIESDQPILSTEHRIYHTFEAEFILEHRSIFALAGQQPGALADTTTWQGKFNPRGTDGTVRGRTNGGIR